MDNNLAIAWLKDEDGRYIYLNQTYQDRFDIREADWLGKTDFDVWPPLPPKSSGVTTRPFWHPDAD